MEEYSATCIWIVPRPTPTFLVPTGTSSVCPPRLGNVNIQKISTYCASYCSLLTEKRAFLEGLDLQKSHLTIMVARKKFSNRQGKRKQCPAFGTRKSNCIQSALSKRLELL